VVRAIAIITLSAEKVERKEDENQEITIQGCTAFKSATCVFGNT
jgi:hypothetical protein